MSHPEYRMAFEAFGLVIEVLSDDQRLFEGLPRALPRAGVRPTARSRRRASAYRATDLSRSMAQSCPAATAIGM